jgi:hypothetical protein
VNKVVDEQMVCDAMTLAYLDERDLMLDIVNRALDFMAHVEDFRNKVGDSPTSPQAIVAKGRLFGALHAAHKAGLRKRMIEVKERLEQAARKYQRQFMKGWKHGDGSGSGRTQRSQGAVSSQKRRRRGRGNVR